MRRARTHTHTQLCTFFPLSSTCTQSLSLRHKDSLFLNVQLVFTSTPLPLLSTSSSPHPRPPTPNRLQAAHHSINGSHSSIYTCVRMCEFVCPESASVESLHYRHETCHRLCALEARPRNQSLKKQKSLSKRTNMWTHASAHGTKCVQMQQSVTVLKALHQKPDAIKERISSGSNLKLI